MLSAVAITVLTVVSKESQIGGSDLRRTQTFYAAAAGIEKMTSDFNALFSSTSRPTAAQLIRIRDTPPVELTGEGYGSGIAGLYLKRRRRKSASSQI